MCNFCESVKILFCHAEGGYPNIPHREEYSVELMVTACEEGTGRVLLENGAGRYALNWCPVCGANMARRFRRWKAGR